MGVDIVQAVLDINSKEKTEDTPDRKEQEWYGCRCVQYIKFFLRDNVGCKSE
jgi:hypothetical protein